MEKKCFQLLVGDIPLGASDKAIKNGIRGHEVTRVIKDEGTKTAVMDFSKEDEAVKAKRKLGGLAINGIKCTLTIVETTACSVCGRGYDESYNYKVYVSPCMHSFCFDCYEAALDNGEECPVCKQRITKGSDAPEEGDVCSMCAQSGEDMTELSPCHHVLCNDCYVEHQSYDPTKCPVCHSDLSTATDSEDAEIEEEERGACPLCGATYNEDNEEIILLPCEHKVCEDCYNAALDNDEKCPICKYKIVRGAFACDETSTCEACSGHFLDENDKVTIKKCNHTICKPCFDIAEENNQLCPVCGGPIN